MDIYLINLARRPDRLAAMQAQAERLGLALNAAGGAGRQRALIQNPWTAGSSGGPLGEIPRGDKCCSLSHRIAWEKLLASGDALCGGAGRRCGAEGRRRFCAERQ